MQTRRTQQQSLITALTKSLFMIGMVLALAFYGVGGWYFSDIIKDEVLDVAPWEREFDVLVEAASAETVALDTLGDSRVRSPGLYELVWDDGSGVVGDIVESVGTTVIRDFAPLHGDSLAPDDLVDFDTWMWDDPEQGFGVPFQSVTFDGPLGELGAWVIPGETEAWLVGVHGKGADRRELLRIASVANRAGFNVLLIDYRNDADAYDDPSGMYQYGLTEWEDLESAVEYTMGRGASRIVLAGMSTGAAISLQFLYESEFAERVDAAIFDSANIDMERSIRHSASQTKLPVIGWTVPDSLATAAIWLAERRFEIDVDAWNFIERADELSIPLLVIHGDLDERVPDIVSVDLESARPDLVTYVQFDGAGHVSSWNIDRIRYADVITTFLEGGE
jgi:hypothetical protein